VRAVGSTTGSALDDALQQGAVAVPDAVAVSLGGCQKGLHRGPGGVIHDGLVNAVEHLVTGPHLADLDRIGEQPAKGAAVEGPAPPDLTALRLPALCGPPPPNHLSDCSHHRVGFDEQPENLPDMRGLFGVDDEPFVLEVVPEHGPAAHSQSVPAGCTHLVRGSLSNDLPFELGKAHQNVEREFSHGVGCRELLCHSRERDVMHLEKLGDSCEVQQAARTGTAGT